MCEPLEELPGYDFCFRSDPTKNDPFMGLPVKYDGSLRGCYHHRNYRKILLTIDNNGDWGACNRFIDCINQISGQAPRGIFHPDTVSPEGRLFAAGSPHSETVDNCYIRGDPFSLEIMRYDIPNSVNDLVCQKRKNLPDIPVQIAKRFLEELAVLFGQCEHQRTFRA
jgi:hypothetical protein